MNHPNRPPHPQNPPRPAQSARPPRPPSGHPPQNRPPGYPPPRPGHPGPNRPKNPPRRPLSPEDRARMEQLRRAREEARRKEQRREQRIREQEAARRRAERRETWRIIGGRLLVFLVVLTALTLLALGAFYLSFLRTPDKPPDSGQVTFFYGGEEVRTAPLQDCLRGPSRWFCFNDLAKYLHMSESGTADALKFILPASSLPDTAAGSGREESIVFFPGQMFALVNGQIAELDAPSILRGSEIWVSTQVIEDYMVHLSLQTDPGKKHVRISRVADPEQSTEEETVYLPPAFRLKSTSPIDAIEENPLIGDLPFTTDPDADTGALLLTFQTDVSAEEAYMNPAGEMADAFLVLVNAEHPLEASYTPADLRKVEQTSIISEQQTLAEYASRALDALFRELRAAEFYNMAVYAGYRSYESQSRLFEAEVQARMAADPSLSEPKAREQAAQTVEKPGTSEHQTGLAVDMDTLGAVTTDFQFEPEYRWLLDHAWKFGFILRYPPDKTKITGHAFEPWHYRFVGRVHAQKMHASGLCLEEYLDTLS